MSSSAATEGNSINGIAGFGAGWGATATGCGVGFVAADTDTDGVHIAPVALLSATAGPVGRAAADIGRAAGT